MNETLLDLAPLKTSVGAALGGREDLLPLWFTTVLHCSLVHTLTEDYRGFAQIGVAALMMIGERQGIGIDRGRAEEAIIEPLLHLPPHPDVKPALKRLARSDIEIVSLANSAAAAAVTVQFEFADIIQYFDRRISTEEVRAFPWRRSSTHLHSRHTGRPMRSAGRRRPASSEIHAEFKAVRAIRSMNSRRSFNGHFGAWNRRLAGPTAAGAK